MSTKLIIVNPHVHNPSSYSNQPSCPQPRIFNPASMLRQISLRIVPLLLPWSFLSSYAAPDAVTLSCYEISCCDWTHAITPSFYESSNYAIKPSSYETLMPCKKSTHVQVAHLKLIHHQAHAGLEAAHQADGAHHRECPPQCQQATHWYNPHHSVH